ncbi:hypothetical protein BC834DRAFT_15227 [Gloeopeniophorella convolvens]|nr:hypothetical protein BC834DRAFT_15227 [Gloeopeniophorella convolvens]
MSHQSALLSPPTSPEEDELENWSEVTDHRDAESAHQHIEQVDRPDGDLAVKADNLATQDVDKPPSVPILDSTLNVPSPVLESPAMSIRDSASMHSIPTLQVTEPQGSSSLPQSPDIPSFSDDEDAPSVHRSIGSSTAVPPPSPRRPARPRSALDGRSPNRLSGFFSQFIHRRDHLPPSPNTFTHQERASPTPEESAVPSRSSSPMQVARPSTPPPPLPPPSLGELGLSLSVLTDHMSPSHFSTPPTSGAFLAPHYLLLCHAQGLDVLPLVSPPAPVPYALIRRVSFKSVVVMEHRGVLVAISGRRDGVRVYALDEIKKAVEWRLDVEIRRERDKLRREEAKRAPPRDVTPGDIFSLEKMALSRSSPDRSKSVRRSPSAGAAFASPKGPQLKKTKTPPQPSHQAPHLPPAISPIPSGPPPSYSSPSPPRRLLSQHSAGSLHDAGGRGQSVNDVLRGTVSRRATDVVELDNSRDGDTKTDWLEESHSDDEAINVVAAGASGSRALDERTSSMAAAESIVSNASGLDSTVNPAQNSRPLSTATLTPTGFRRARPSDLDLSAIRADPHPAVPPSPTPTLLTLRQALLASPSSGPVPTMSSINSRLTDPPAPDLDIDDDDENENGAGTPTNDRISFAEALMESRIPDLPPPGTRVPQQAILFTQSHSVATGEDDAPSSPVSLSAQSNRTRQSHDTQGSRRRRRRWSVLDGIFSGPGEQPEAGTPTTPSHLPESHSTQTRERSPAQRSQSPYRSSQPTSRPSTRGSDSGINLPPVPVLPHSRFFSRILGGAFTHRRSEDSTDSLQRMDNIENGTRRQQSLAPPHAPAPKLEYVKLPGTKGSLMIKAVETNRKSFLAILCGDNGEKVELFAGTYRTALGLSRTFILPDSPRSLELQLQGDDLVEVFLVFSQNVFGLEPATVRVREVRLGRAERRAARRRARELQAEDPLGPETDAPPTVEDTTNVNVSVGLSVPSSVSVTTEISAGTTLAGGVSPSPSQANISQRSGNAAPKIDDLVPIPSGPYTTFQQLSFSPNFPLAAIVDDYIIPPTYPDFLHYRSVHEPDINGNVDVDLSQVQFSPPGLPLPPAAPPSQWYYRDPKGVVHGPWSSSRMQAWYREALLPPDLPVRREEDTDYVLLKDLRQHCVDPSQPFGPSPIRAPSGESSSCDSSAGKPLLSPISLLTQSRIFGPPALFYSSRGGHSTSIVDGRGRSVLKDRFVWTPDEQDADGQTLAAGRLGDIKRLEAFDVQDRSILVAMRQGGFEAVDLRDALLRPADASRDFLPHFTSLPFQMNRRKIFTWRIGSPVNFQSPYPTTQLPRKPSRHTVPTKKMSTGPGKSPARPEFGGDADGERLRDEIVWLGRQDDNIYLCERDADKFRILRLSPIGAR